MHPFLFQALKYLLGTQTALRDWRSMGAKADGKYGWLPMQEHEPDSLPDLGTPRTYD